MSFLRRQHRPSAPTTNVQLQLRWRNGAWHLFNLYFFTPVNTFTDLDTAQQYIDEHKFIHYSLEGVGIVR